MRWIWIDRITHLDSGKSAKAIKCLSLAEDHFTHHFPGYPVMPACFVLEGLAQTGGILVGEVSGFREKVVLAKVNRAVFHREMYPGEVLHYEAQITNMRQEGASVDARVTVHDQLTVEAEIFFAFLDQSRSQEIFGEENFVFTGEFRYLLQRMARAKKE
ncbi:MAG: beta-hydroxyacyl-ACP dehydratase [Gemmataceae bacterium]